MSLYKAYSEFWGKNALKIHVILSIVLVVINLMAYKDVLSTLQFEITLVVVLIISFFLATLMQKRSISELLTKEVKNEFTTFYLSLFIFCNILGLFF